MSMEWSKQKLEWFAEAIHYTGYYEKLSRAVAPYVRGARVCDMGCGLGFLDIALAGEAAEITCFDRNPDAIAMLKSETAARRIANIHARVMDVSDFSDTDYDCLLMTFFDYECAELPRYLDLCRRYLLLIVHSDEEEAERQGPAIHAPDALAGATERFLNERGLTFDMSRSDIEFGQPFPSEEAAMRYVEEYYASAVGAESELRELKESMRRCLVKKQDARYPYYMPKRRKSVFFAVHKNGAGL